MDRYNNLDLDLECEGANVSQKSSIFGGMLKRSSKSADPPVQAQDALSTNSELSKSRDSLTSNSSKEKGGVFKGMFKKTTKSVKEEQPQDNLSQNPELSVSSDNLTSNKAAKGVFGGILKRSPKPGHVRRPSQDLLDNEFTGSNDSLSENNATKETGGMFKGMFKKSPKLLGARTQSQDDLSEPGENSGSTDNVSVNSNTKEAEGIFTGLFKKSPKLFGARTQSQDDLSAASELSGSCNNLIENNNIKEKGGIFSGVFKKKVAKSQSQDDLSVEVSANTDSLKEKPSKAEAAVKVLKNPFTSSSQENNESAGGSNENTSNADKLKSKQNGFSAVMKSTFYSDKTEKNSDSDCEEILDNGEQTGHKQWKFGEMMTKLNPFRAANKHEKHEDPHVEEKSTASKQKEEDTEALSAKKQVEDKPKVVKSNAIQREMKQRNETPPVPPRPSEEEMKRTSTYRKAKSRGTEDDQEQSDDESLEKDQSARAKEGDKANSSKRKTGLPDDERLKEEDSSFKEEKKDEEDKENKTEESQPKKHKRHNPFMPRVKAPSDDEELKDKEDSSSKVEKKDKEGTEKTEQTRVKKPKKHNPFMPRVKGKMLQKNAQGGAAGNTAENDGGNRSLFDQLEDFRVDPTPSEDREDVEGLMDWWNTVESWEDTPQDDSMTEKEEAKAFAVTAEKVQKGIRVFNKLFSERAESLWQHVIDLNSIADGLDKFSKNTKIAQITGGSTSAIGGVATIAGLALAPVTMGTSLIVTAVGLGVATAGGLTSAGAGISNQVNNSMDRKKVEKIVQDYQEKIADLNKCLKFIKQGIENLKRFDLIKMKQHAYNRDFPVLSSSFYEDGAMAGKAILINANEIMRVVQIANVAGSTAARAVQIASMATGVLTGLFVGMDIYFVAKDSKELKKGAKSEFAAKIREVATQLHDGLVELNVIREELQASTPEKEEGDPGALDSDKKNKDTKDDDSSEEDEIDRIKKAIKKDIESREYV